MYLVRATACFIMLLALSRAMASPVEFDVIAYHDVRDAVVNSVDTDQYAISTSNLVDHFNWLQINGFVPVSVDQILAARDGKGELPAKAVLLTFDDGLESVYTHVFPLLQLFHYPAVVSIVTGWTTHDVPPPPPDGSGIQYEFLGWDKVREMLDSGLVEIASHSHNLHRGIVANPQGNEEPAAVTRWYHDGRYETDSEYLARIRSDLETSVNLIEANTGRRPRVMTWPYGRFNAQTVGIAADLGMSMTLTLTNERGSLSDLSSLGRHLVLGNPSVDRLGLDLLQPPQQQIVRVAQIDLDYIYDPDEARQEQNLGRLLDRIKSLQISHVFLQAFADPDSDGGAQSVYFPNRHLPVRADLFNRVAWQLSTRSDVLVYGWLPILSYEGEAFDPSMRVQQLKNGKVSTDEKSEPRLSVFDPRARQLITDLYEDLAKSSAIDGILFHDDGRLNEFEDANPAAIAAYKAEFGPDFSIERTLDDPEMQRRWAQFKTRALVDFTQSLEATVKRYRPAIKTARNLFATALLDPNGETYLAQSYESFADAYDYIALMAMPYLEKSKHPRKFLEQLIDDVGLHERGFEKTIFELQTVDWQTNEPLPAVDIRDTMRWLQAHGVRNIGYYPDDFILGYPALQELRSGISLAIYPVEAKR